VRFRDKVAALVARAAEGVEVGEETSRLRHQTVQKVTQQVDQLGFNTAIASMMVFANHLAALDGDVPREPVETLVLLVSPFAPHLGEEMWEKLGNTDSIAHATWPTFDEALTIESTVTLGIQVNGKVRGQVQLSPDASEDEAREAASSVDSVFKFIEGKEVKKFIYRPGKIINFVVAK